MHNSFHLVKCTYIYVYIYIYIYILLYTFVGRSCFSPCHETASLQALEQNLVTYLGYVRVKPKQDEKILQNISTFWLFFCYVISTYKNFVVDIRLYSYTRPLPFHTRKPVIATVVRSAVATIYWLLYVLRWCILKIRSTVSHVTVIKARY